MLAPKTNTANYTLHKRVPLLPFTMFGFLAGCPWFKYVCRIPPSITAAPIGHSAAAAEPPLLWAVAVSGVQLSRATIVFVCVNGAEQLVVLSVGCAPPCGTERSGDVGGRMVGAADALGSMVRVGMESFYGEMLGVVVVFWGWMSSLHF